MKTLDRRPCQAKLVVLDMAERTNSKASITYGMKVELAKSSGLFLSEMDSSTTMIVEEEGVKVFIQPTALTIWDHLSTRASTCSCEKEKSESPSSRPKTAQPSFDDIFEAHS